MKLPQYDPHMLNFFHALSVCHTVQVAKLDKIKIDSEADVEKSFEIIDSSGSLVDIEEEAKRKEETRQNTKQNEVCVPDNLIDNLPVAVESKSHIY